MIAEDIKLPLLDMPFGADRLTKEIESSFRVGKPTNNSRSVTGEPYIIIGHQTEGRAAFPGTVDECMPRQISLDVENAYWTARAAFQLYAKGRDGVLYWRMKPQMEHYDNFCFIYMRCLISDKPVV